MLPLIELDDYRVEVEPLQVSICPWCAGQNTGGCTPCNGTGFVSETYRAAMGERYAWLKREVENKTQKRDALYEDVRGAASAVEGERSGRSFGMAAPRRQCSGSRLSKSSRFYNEAIQELNKAEKILKDFIAGQGEMICL